MLTRMETATKVRAMLARAPGLTAEHVRAVLAGGGDEIAFSYPAHVLRQVGIPPAARAFLTAPDEAELVCDLRWIDESGAQLILCTDTAYPPLLAQTAGAPRCYSFSAPWRLCTRHSSR